MKYSERIEAIRKELESLSDEKVNEVFKGLVIVLADVEIPLKRKIDILVSEISEDPDDEPGLIYAGNVEKVLKELKKSKT